jgi:hypothetical protein
MRVGLAGVFAGVARAPAPPRGAATGRRGSRAAGGVGASPERAVRRFSPALGFRRLGSALEVGRFAWAAAALGLDLVGVLAVSAMTAYRVY